MGINQKTYILALSVSSFSLDHDLIFYPHSRITHLFATQYHVRYDFVKLACTRVCCCTIPWLHNITTVDNQLIFIDETERDGTLLTGLSRGEHICQHYETTSGSSSLAKPRRYYPDCQFWPGTSFNRNSNSFDFFVEIPVLPSTLLLPRPPAAAAAQPWKNGYIHLLSFSYRRVEEQLLLLVSVCTCSRLN